MKKLVFILLVLFFFNDEAKTQVSGVAWNAEIFQFNGETLNKFPNKPIDVDITLKRENDEILFKEHHVSTLDAASRLSLNIGAGVKDPLSPDNSAATGLLLGAKFCYTVVIHDNINDKTVMGMSPIGDVPKTLFAEDSKSLGGYEYDFTGFALESLYNPDFSDKWCLLAKYDAYENDLEYHHYIRPIDENDFMNIKQIPSSRTGKLLTVTGFGIQSEHHCPLNFSREFPSAVSDYIYLPAWVNEDYTNGLAVRVPKKDTSLTHSTYAASFENPLNTQGVGSRSIGSNIGSINFGINGVFGITNGTENGAGVNGVVAQAPATNGFKYGAYATSGGFPFSYSGAYFGPGFYTETWMQMSDARLKSDVEPTVRGLADVMKLRPAQYRYIQGTPYQFSNAEHFGFIAQEMEEVIPEVVGDIILPTSIDKENNSFGEGTAYKGINYPELIPVLTKAIQELNTKVEQQAAEIDELKKLLQHKDHK